MKKRVNLKNKLSYLIIGILALGFCMPLQAQVNKRDHRTKTRTNTTTKAKRASTVGTDPFTRLKNKAKQSAVNKTSLSAVVIAKNDPNWKRTKKTPRTYVPFKLESENANRIVTLKNGTTTTEEAYLKQINALEKKLNSEGRSLRDGTTSSKLITNNKFLDYRKSLAPKSVTTFKTEPEVERFMSTERRVKITGTTTNNRTAYLTIKPYSSYTPTELANISKYDFSATRAGKVTAKKNDNRKRFKDLMVHKYGNLSSLYEFDKTDIKNWSFGNPNHFQARIEGSISRFAKIYPFDPKLKDINKSEFRVKATGKATGSIFGHSMDILNASCEFYAPSNVSKVMTATISVKAFEMNLFPKQTLTFPQEKSISKEYGKSFDKSFPLTIPVLPGIDFKGLLGVKGEVGFECKGEIQRTLASVKAKPLVSLKAYGEGGLSFFSVVEGGVEAELTFIKSELDLNAYAGIFNQNSENIVAGISHYFGYKVDILSGSINAYGKICSPIPIPFLPDCYRDEVELFKWEGFKDSGTITQGGFTPITLANIAEYKAPVFTQD